jgi:hypothetical protein
MNAHPSWSGDSRKIRQMQTVRDARYTALGAELTSSSARECLSVVHSMRTTYFRVWRGTQLRSPVCESEQIDCVEGCKLLSMLVQGQKHCLARFGGIG